MTDYKRRYEALFDYSPDGEDCDACFVVSDLCPYHVGVAEAVEWMSKHLRRIADDPEVLNVLAERRAVSR